MCIKAVSRGVHYEMQTDEKFPLLFSVISSQLASILNELVDFDDYCMFIKAYSRSTGVDIVFHDGGAKYNPELDEMERVVYRQVRVELPIVKEYSLFFDVNERILCFLEER